MSISDIDQWSPESISAVSAALADRAGAAEQASSRLKGLSAFDSWQGAGADAAQARTQVLAVGIDQHGQAVATVSKAATIAADEVRQIKAHLARLRSTLGQYGIIVDAANSRVVPPPNVSSLSPAHRKLVEDVALIGQHSVDKIRHAADLADGHLANAMQGKRDDFDLDTQYARPQGSKGKHCK
ncbi:hypothetical protein [Mycolicibacterium doricum]|uniref:hypothetical protein n=1 Tax=Mycolicibacterium doricum TaxID=126673 RepID=UPI001054B67D|nr:hypothetical protein [Mycolicibacterium doricum]MCV7268204.1 hypothetical protein [Mycolicibacterium doricum]